MEDLIHDDVSLALRAWSGDRVAFEELVRRTTRMIYAKLYLETGDPHLAEDLTQETFLRAFRSIGRLGDPAGVRGWLAAIAQSAAIDSFRYASRQRRSGPRRENAEVLDRTSAPPSESGASHETREKVRAILQSLPEQYRLPLTLRYLNGEEYDAIQEQLGLTNGSLRGLLHRGLKMLKQELEKEGVR